MRFLPSTPGRTAAEVLLTVAILAFVVYDLGGQSSAKPEASNVVLSFEGKRPSALPAAEVAAPSSRFLKPLPTAVSGASVDMGLACGFAVLGASGITNVGATTVIGDIGSFPTGTETGFGTLTLTGENHGADGYSHAAHTDLEAAYTDAQGRAVTGTLPPNLGGKTVLPGVYVTAPGTLAITGVLTLDGVGNSDAVFIFKAASTLITATSSQVVLINGARAKNVFWVVGSSATLGTHSQFTGTIMAYASITLKTGAVVTEGRLLARTGAITLGTNSVTGSPCNAATAPTPTVMPCTLSNCNGMRDKCAGGSSSHHCTG